MTRECRKRDTAERAQRFDEVVGWPRVRQVADVEKMVAELKDRNVL